MFYKENSKNFGAANFFEKQKIKLFEIQTAFFLQPFTKYLGQTLVFMWNNALRESSISFSSFLLLLTKKIILGGRLGTRL